MIKFTLAMTVIALLTISAVGSAVESARPVFEAGYGAQYD